MNLLPVNILQYQASTRATKNKANLTSITYHVVTLDAGLANALWSDSATAFTALAWFHDMQRTCVPTDTAHVITIGNACRLQIAGKAESGTLVRARQLDG